MILESLVVQLLAVVVHYLGVMRLNDRSGVVHLVHVIHIVKVRPIL